MLRPIIGNHQHWDLSGNHMHGWILIAIALRCVGCDILVLTLFPRIDQSQTWRRYLACFYAGCCHTIVGLFAQFISEPKKNITYVRRQLGRKQLCVATAVTSKKAARICTRWSIGSSNGWMCCSHRWVCGSTRSHIYIVPEFYFFSPSRPSNTLDVPWVGAVVPISRFTWIANCTQQLPSTTTSWRTLHNIVVSCE